MAEFVPVILEEVVVKFSVCTHVDILLIRQILIQSYLQILRKVNITVNIKHLSLCFFKHQSASQISL